MATAKSNTETMDHTPSGSTLDTRNINVWYGDKHAVIDVSLPHTPGITALIGPSGCGKTSYLRCINRMHELKPDAKWTGEVLLNGKNILQTDATLIRQRIGMVFQKSTAFSKSIFDNTAFGLRLTGTPTKDLPGKVQKALEQAVLWDEVKDRLGTSGTKLSGGQEQRLCIARALAVTPDVLLLDEPTAALDPPSTNRIENLLTELKEHYTIIMVTHNMEQARRVSDRTAFFYEGRLIEHGPTQEMFTNPKEKLTDDYIRGRFG